VRATTVNRTDVAVLRGIPYAMRLFSGFFRPKYAVTGTDFAGVVAGLGENATGFNIGDRVYGFFDQGLPTHAEYVSVPEGVAMLKIPAAISFEQAVASAEGFHYAVNFINKVQLEPGQRILVNGATGAIGSALVQILKCRGAEVTAVCAGANVERVKALGPDRVINYEQEDFTRLPETFHYVFDAVGKSSFGRCKPLLKPKGAYISSELGAHWENIYLSLFTPLLGGKKVLFPMPADIHASLALSQEMLENGTFRPLIDRTYPLNQIADAFTYVMSGQKIGNVVVGLYHKSKTEAG
jgi:NADPH:quinone reductase-like Zn-dependent oxidoreductase